MARQASALPPYQALLAVDIRDFSGILGRDHAQITDVVPTILGAAFERCGLLRVWRGRRFTIGTGDGCAVGFPSEVLPYLLNPFLQSLQDELDFRDQVRTDPVSVRLRVSINVGPVTDSGQGLLSEGSGTSRIELHRLLDADPVKELLNRSGPTTRVVAIVSTRAYHDAVLAGYAADSPEHYVAVPVKVKKMATEGYLRVPSPTGDLLRSGFLPRDAEPREVGPAVDPSSTTREATHSYTIHGTGNINSGPGNQFNGPGATYHDKRRP